MNRDLYTKLVDIYAERELPIELEEEMELAARYDGELGRDMRSLRNTVDLVRSTPSPEFTDESYQRVLMKIYARSGVNAQLASTPSHLQYHLPIQG
jgi:hypothetical protein